MHKLLGKAVIVGLEISDEGQLGAANMSVLVAMTAVKMDKIMN